MASFNAAHLAALDSAARQRQRSELLGLNAYDRHKRFVHDLTTYYGGTLPSSDNLESLANQQQQQQQPNAAGEAPVTTSNNNLLKRKIVKTDEDTIRESYRFIRTSEDDADEDSWTVRLAKKYYSRLFREYCIADFSRYKEGKLGLRWRTQREVVSGKGQFSCGTRGCEERRGLASFEVPFGYVEAEQKKQALVKVRLCPEHAYQLNYKKNREAEKQQETAIKRRKKEKRKKKKRKKEIETSSSGGGGDSDAEEEGELLTHRKKVRTSDDGLEELFSGLFE